MYTFGTTMVHDVNVFIIHTKAHVKITSLLGSCLRWGGHFVLPSLTIHVLQSLGKRHWFVSLTQSRLQDYSFFSIRLPVFPFHIDCRFWWVHAVSLLTSQRNLIYYPFVYEEREKCCKADRILQTFSQSGSSDILKLNRIKIESSDFPITHCAGGSQCTF